MLHKCNRAQRENAASGILSYRNPKQTCGLYSNIAENEETVMVSMTKVSKRLGDFKLDNISMNLPQGYIMGMIGLNGAGKTTLLHLILHLYFPDQGEIRFDEKTYEENDVLIKNEIGYVLSEDLFAGELTLEENADLYGKYYVNYNKDLFREYCRQFSLSVDEKLKKFSKGEKLKFQFAFALSHNPKLLILDEPTANFDPDFRGQFLRLITKFVEDGEHSVLLATHLTKDLDQIADYILFLHKGKVLYQKDREELFDTYRLVSGETYQLKLLPKEKIVYQEDGSFGSRALVRHSRLNHYHRELEIRRLTIEEIMYYTIKGGAHV